MGSWLISHLGHRPASDSCRAEAAGQQLTNGISHVMCSVQTPDMSIRERLGFPGRDLCTC